MSSCVLFDLYVDDRDLHSFPTRRSSDLTERGCMRRAHRETRRPTRGGPRGGVCGNRKVLFQGHSEDRKSTRLNSSHTVISYAVFCLKKKKKKRPGEDSQLHKQRRTWARI